MVRILMMETNPTPAVASIAGGFVLVPVASLMAGWRACQRPGIGIGAFRAWLALREMVARRTAIGEGRAPAYTFAELARLAEVSPKRARVLVARVVDAGLIEWGNSSIVFLDPPFPPDPTLDDTLGRGRGSVAIPRRLLRHLAGGVKPATIATALGVLLRCLSRRRSGFDGRGRVKSAWIARTFAVDPRRVKQARRELVELGWIDPEPSGQRTENRWGRAFRIDLAWDRPGPAGGRSLPPLPPPGRPAIATPSVDQEPFQERNQHQEPASGGPTGTRLGKVGGRNGTPRGPRELAIPKPTIEASPASKPGPSPAPPSATPVVIGLLPKSDPSAPPRLRDVRVEDLKDTGRTLALLAAAVGLGWVGSSEADCLRFVGAAEHALAIGRGNPAGLFIHLVRGRLWRYLTQEDEVRANSRIKVFLRGPEPHRVASSSSRPPARPLLSEDARVVIRVRSALAAAGYRGNPFPQVMRHDPSWTRERWDAALAELDGA